MSPDVESLKRWMTERARACRHGVAAWRTDPVDGPVMIFSIRHGVARQHEGLQAFAAYVAELDALGAPA